MPDLKVLENPKTNLASEILSEDGKTIAKFYFNDNRTPVSFSEFPQHLVNALLATEDIRFYNHSGIDWISTLRAIVKLGKDLGISSTPTIILLNGKTIPGAIPYKQLEEYLQ